MRVRLLGSLLEIRADEPVASRLLALLAAHRSGSTDRHGGGEKSAVVVSAHRRERVWTVDGPQGPLQTGSAAHALELVLSQLNHCALARCPGFAVHAGVVARDGAALALPASSGAGKSTLVAALLQAGWDYVSDEALVADWATGELLPYPKPLTLLAWSLERLGLAAPPTGRDERSLDVCELGARVAGPPLRLAHVVVPRRGPGPAALSPLHRAQAAQVLLENSFNHWTDPPAALRTVAALVRGAQTWTLETDDPVEAARVLDGLV